MWGQHKPVLVLQSALKLTVSLFVTCNNTEENVSDGYICFIILCFNGQFFFQITKSFFLIMGTIAEELTYTVQFMHPNSNTIIHSGHWQKKMYVNGMFQC